MDFGDSSPVSRAELILKGASALQTAYGEATLRKAALVVDAILADYTITRKETDRG